MVIVQQIAQNRREITLKDIGKTEPCAFNEEALQAGRIPFFTRFSATIYAGAAEVEI